MKFITLGKHSVPAIGLGTYKLTGSGAIDIIRNAIDIGYRHIDTAQLYDNENEVGQAILNSNISREEIFLVTKVWPSNLHKDRFMKSVKESLQKLKTDHVDLLLIHWPHQSMKVEEYIPFLIEARDSGLTSEIGVSNFNIPQLKTALKLAPDIVVNQVEFHPWINQAKLYDWMKDHNLALTAYSPLAQGKMIGSKQLGALGSKYNRTPAQIVLRWMMQKESILAIPRSSNMHRLQENLNVFDFELVKEDVEDIDAWRLENHRMVGAQNGAKWD
ncbi:MAG: aldo/keto reductase [Saprospiraceae bacterium]|uniref:Aldo/keto reductase n=1 Tax=Candidatus Opimibacter skivensis TaxID=2982028 RepID=A0A9D7SRW3_9BACT|nr:aldo/keto reductase [Candidatus Opimibacter skivensis]